MTEISENALIVFNTYCHHYKLWHKSTPT